jgi:hypothetical protein
LNLIVATPSQIRGQNAYARREKSFLFKGLHFLLKICTKMAPELPQSSSEVALKQLLICTKLVRYVAPTQLQSVKRIVGAPD